MTVTHEALVRLLADGALIAIIVTAAIILLKQLWWRRFWLSMPYVIMAGLSSLLVGKLMSLIYQPTVARPFIELGVAPGAAFIDNPGFPSDHALLGTAIVLAVLTLVRWQWAHSLLLGLLLLMCVARVSALVHTPLDVIFGVIAGLSGGVWYLARPRRHA